MCKKERYPAAINKVAAMIFEKVIPATIGKVTLSTLMSRKSAIKLRAAVNEKTIPINKIGTDSNFSPAKKNTVKNNSTCCIPRIMNEISPKYRFFFWAYAIETSTKETSNSNAIKLSEITKADTTNNITGNKIGIRGLPSSLCTYSKIRISKNQRIKPNASPNASEPETAK